MSPGDMAGKSGTSIPMSCSTTHRRRCIIKFLSPSTNTSHQHPSAGGSSCLEVQITVDIRYKQTKQEANEQVGLDIVKIKAT